MVIAVYHLPVAGLASYNMAKDGSHHRWDLASKSQGTNPNGIGPYSGGTNPDLGLPNASGGQRIYAGFINDSANGITDNKIRSSDSHDINRSGRGVTLTSRTPAFNSPFFVSGAGKGYLCMNMGRLFTLNSNQKYDIRQTFPNYKPTNESEAMFNRGGEFNIDIKFNNNVASYGTDGNTVTNSGGRFASKIFFGANGGAPWTTAGEMPDDYALYFSYANGLPIPTLLYKKLSEMPESNVMPVAYVMKNGIIIQILNTNAAFYSEQWSFGVSVFKSENDWKFRVGPGYINAVMPKYESTGKLLTDTDSTGTFEAVTGNYDTHGIFVKSQTNNSEPYVFPDPSKCFVASKKEIPPTDNTWSWLLIAAVTFSKNEAGEVVSNGVQQVVRSSLHAIAWKVDPSGNKTYNYWNPNNY